MGKRIYTDAQREEAARLFAASTLDQQDTVVFVAEQTGMSEQTVRALAASRGLTKPERKYKKDKMPPDEREWIRKVREEVKPPPTPTTTCERCPMTRNAGGGHMTTLCATGNCLLNKREVTE